MSRTRTRPHRPCLLVRACVSPRENTEGHLSARAVGLKWQTNHITSDQVPLMSMICPNDESLGQTLEIGGVMTGEVSARSQSQREVTRGNCVTERLAVSMSFPVTASRGISLKARHLFD